jgi:glycosyltransferase involved in cell wall biosynthesis
MGGKWLSNFRDTNKKYADWKGAQILSSSMYGVKIEEKIDIEKSSEINERVRVPNLSSEQPRIIFDVMANGLVVIGLTNPFKGIIKSGINGILCDPRNPESFALAVQRLYEDRGSQERLV